VDGMKDGFIECINGIIDICMLSVGFVEYWFVKC